MRTLVSLLGLLIALNFADPEAMAQSTTEKDLARVEQLQGIYIFSDCKPVAKYKYLGTIKRNTGGFGGSQYADVRDGLIKQIKKEYPEADGIILILKSGGTDRADAIKFE